MKDKTHETSGMLFEISLPSVQSKMLACNKRLSWSFSIWQVEISQKEMVALLWSWIKCQMSVLYGLCLASGAFNKCKRASVLISDWESEKQRAGASPDGARAVDWREMENVWLLNSRKYFYWRIWMGMVLPWQGGWGPSPAFNNISTKSAQKKKSNKNTNYFLVLSYLLCNTQLLFFISCCFLLNFCNLQQTWMWNTSRLKSIYRVRYWIFMVVILSN